jgi:ribose-phosphate pyrophosphokinase
MSVYNDEITLIAGNAHRELAESISAALDRPLADADVGRFPDGEVDIKVNEDLRGRDVFVIQPTCPPVNENWCELLLLLDTLRRASAGRITAVMPYYGYARKDRKDEGRVPISAKVVANTLVASGAERVVTLDMHAAQIQGFFDIPVDHLYAAPVLTKYFRDLKLKDLVVVAPDVGSAKMARGTARRLEASFAIIDKRRPKANTSEVLNVVGEVEGMTCLLIDDMVDTAGTLANAVYALKERGAAKVYAAATHALFSGEAVKRLSEAPIEEMVVTNTIDIPEHKRFDNLRILSVADLLAKAIDHVHSNESVSQLFERLPDD